MQQPILAFPSLAAGSEGDAPKAWVTFLSHAVGERGSLTSPILGLSTHVRKHDLFTLHLDKWALWRA